MSELFKIEGECLCLETGVTETKRVNGHTRRRRKCDACGKVEFTYEINSGEYEVFKSARDLHPNIDRATDALDQFLSSTVIPDVRPLAVAA